MDLGAPELLIILAIGLLIFGANKLPKLARSLGQASKEFKAATTEPFADLKTAIAAPDAPTTPAAPATPATPATTTPAPTTDPASAAVPAPAAPTPTTTSTDEGPSGGSGHPAG